MSLHFTSDLLAIRFTGLFYLTALHGDGDVVSYLLEKCEYKTDCQDSCGSTPLMDAVRVDSVNTLQTFINIHKVSGL